MYLYTLPPLHARNRTHESSAIEVADASESGCNFIKYTTQLLTNFYSLMCPIVL